MAFTKKQIPSPTAVISNPANVGPINLAALKTDEFNAIAFGKSFLSSTISITKLCLVGMSKAFIKPENKLRSRICQI